MNESIKTICQLLKEEAEAIISYTEKISALDQMEGMESTKQELDMIRLDEVEHVQKLTLELTRLVMDNPPDPEVSGGANE